MKANSRFRSRLGRFARPIVTAASVAVAVALPGSGAAQTGQVTAPEENFRADPGGEVVARLYAGTTLSLGETRDRWRQATLEAWIWDASVGPYGREVMVNAGGENLRDSPNGDRIGRAEGGMRLEPLGRDGNWLRVRRTAWIWGPSIEVRGPPSEPAAESSTPAPAAPAEGPEAPPAPDAPGYASVGPGTLLRDRPAGDSIARLRAGASVEVVARQGEWTRVRVEGWTRTADFEEPGSAVLVGIGRDSLQARPDHYRGRMVDWTLQFISIQRAEAFRTDFVEGETFLLTRGPGEDDGFVYVAVPEERLGAVQGLSPLERIRVLARVRTARSTLTGAPIVEFRELVP